MIEYSNSQLYNVAMCLLNLKQAYVALVAATKPLTELDLQAFYPFENVDFEAKDKQVDAWCTYHANKILNEVPWLVRNPDCLQHCSKVAKAHVTLDNTCSEGPCTRYPLINFSPTIVKQFLVDNKVLADGNYTVDQLADAYTEYVIASTK